MSMHSDVKTAATDFVDKAVKADKEGNLELAIEMYGNAVQRFMHVRRCEYTDDMKAVYTKRINGYNARARKLKETMKARKDAEEAAAANRRGGGGRRPERETAGGGDNDDDKLRSALLSTIMSSDRPNVKWTDVVGLERAKETLHEAVVLPQLFPQLFTQERRPWSGILLYGPPGTGKSHLARAVATEVNAACFMSVSSADIVSKWQGDSERLIKQLFSIAAEKAPTVIFIDEVDSIAGARSDSQSDGIKRMMTQLFTEMDGVKKTTGMEKRIMVLGATNIPWSLDTAARRRFEKRIYIPLPEESSRRDMFKANVGVSTPHTLTPADFETLAKRTPNFSGADVSIATRTALLQPIRRLQTAELFRKVGDDKFTPASLEEFEAFPCPHRPRMPETRDDVSNSFDELPFPMDEYPTPVSTPPPAWTECEACGFVRMRMSALRQEQLECPPVTMADFITALTSVRPSVSVRDLAAFENWTKEFGMEG